MNVLPYAREIEDTLAALPTLAPHLPQPNAWQVTLGVLRMWHRVLFRTETVGSSSDPVRPSLRARALAHKAVRLPALLRAGVIAPLDFSGLASSPTRIVRHLLGAHHEGAQAAYDLELLSIYGTKWIVHVRNEALRIAASRSPEDEALKDLCVFANYHEKLVELCDRALANDLWENQEDAVSPDMSFFGYLGFVASLPTSIEDSRVLLKPDAWKSFLRGDWS